MVGQDAVNTLVAFRDGVGFTGVVFSKLDGDARGGAALSVRGVTGAPVLFSSTGEGLEDFERFHADRMASRILDMGDLLTLIEQAERTFDEKEAADAAAKLASGEFTLDDFLSQLRQLRKMGSMKKILGMMPGSSKTFSNWVQLRRTEKTKGFMPFLMKTYGVCVDVIAHQIAPALKNHDRSP